MSVSSISSGILPYFNPQSVQANSQQFQKDFQQLGQDLQSGNLSAAQSDFATLQSLAPQQTSSANNPIAQAFNQLSQDLQSGNLSAAQQDYNNIQQDFQNQATQPHHHHHHGGHGGGGGGVSQLFNQLGQDLQSGNLAAAQQAYATLQQDFQQYAAGTSAQGQTQSGTSGLSTSA